MMDRQVLRRWLVRVFLLAAAGVLVVRIARHRAELVALREANPLWLLASLLLHVAVLVAGTLVWSWVIRRFPARIGFRPLLRIWSIASLTRYLPGVIWQFLTAGQLATELGVDSRLLFASLAVHLGFMLLGASLVGGGAMLLFSHLPVGFALAGLLPPMLVHPRVVQLALTVLSRLSTRAGLGALPSWRGRWADGLGFLSLGTLCWALYGVAFWAFLRGLLGALAPTFLHALAANAIAFLGGYAVLVVPGGLGARELALAALLRASLPVGVAASAAVLSRLWSIVAELLCAALGLLLHRPGRSRRAT